MKLWHLRLKEVMTLVISCRQVIRQSQRWWIGSQFQLYRDLQVVVDIHQEPKSPDGDETSVVVVQEHAEAQVAGEYKHGVEKGHAADIEPPDVIPEPSGPYIRVKQVLITEMFPEEKTTNSMGDSPVKPKVLRARSPVRMRIFPPRPVGR